MGDLAETLGSGTAFTVISLSAVNELLQYVKCKCVGLYDPFEGKPRDCGIAGKLILNCDACVKLKAEWGSLRAGENRDLEPV